MRIADDLLSRLRDRSAGTFPLVFRLSATDWLGGGIQLEDTIETARALVVEGVDMIDCSSGGIGGKERPSRMTIEQGFQVPFAARIREAADVATMTVGYL